MLRKPPAESAWEWKVPLTLLVLGLVGLMAGSFLTAGTAGVGEVLLGVALLLGLDLPVTVVTMYAAAAVLKMSFGPLKTALVKLAAITVFTLALAQGGEWLGLPWLGWPLAVAASYYLFSNCFDLDIPETVLAVIVMSAVHYAISMAIEVLLHAVTGEA